MQTFLPYPSFRKTARSLDWQRLGKQRSETKQIVMALSNPFYGWANHPAVNMWRGYEEALIEYGCEICKEWRRRGYQDKQLDWFKDRRWPELGLVLPPWVGDKKFHQAHQSNLLRKDPEWYGQYNWKVSADLPYIWPTP